MILHLLLIAAIVLAAVSAAIAAYFLRTSRDPGWRDAWTARQNTDGPLLPPEHPSGPMPAIRETQEDRVARLLVRARESTDATGEMLAVKE